MICSALYDFSYLSLTSVLGLLFLPISPKYGFSDNKGTPQPTRLCCFNICTGISPVSFHPDA